MFWEIPVSLIPIDLYRSRVEVFLISFGLSNTEDVWFVGVEVRIKHLLVDD